MLRPVAEDEGSTGEVAQVAHQKHSIHVQTARVSWRMLMPVAADEDSTGEGAQGAHHHSHLHQTLQVVPGAQCSASDMHAKPAAGKL